MHRQILPALRVAALTFGFLATEAALAGPQQGLNKSLARRVRELQPRPGGDVVLVLADDSEVQGSRRYREGIEALFG